MSVGLRRETGFTPPLIGGWGKTREAALLLTLLLWLPVPVCAQVWADGVPDIPRFEQCLPEQMAAFEQQLRDMPGYGADWQRDAFNIHWVQHCGYLAMGICEVSSNSLICQRRLQAALVARSGELRAMLPAPEDVAGQVLSPLFAQVWALAHGQSAGDDCAGWGYRRMLWCRSFEAALTYEDAVHAWQVARLMGVMGPLDWDALSATGD